MNKKGLPGGEKFFKKLIFIKSLLYPKHYARHFQQHYYIERHINNLFPNAYTTNLEANKTMQFSNYALLKRIFYYKKCY